MSRVRLIKPYLGIILAMAMVVALAIIAANHPVSQPDGMTPPDVAPSSKGPASNQAPSSAGD